MGGISSKKKQNKNIHNEEDKTEPLSNFERVYTIEFTSTKFLDHEPCFQITEWAEQE